MSAGRRSISAPEDLLLRAEKRAAELDYADFSKYIQALIKADYHFGGDILHRRPLPPAPPSSSGTSAVAEALGNLVKPRRRASGSKQ